MKSSRSRQPTRTNHKSVSSETDKKLVEFLLRSNKSTRFFKANSQYPESKKKIENRLAYLKRIQKENPEGFHRTCVAYGLKEKDAATSVGDASSSDQEEGGSKPAAVRSLSSTTSTGPTVATSSQLSDTQKRSHSALQERSSSSSDEEETSSVEDERSGTKKKQRLHHPQNKNAAGARRTTAQSCPLKTPAISPETDKYLIKFLLQEGKRRFSHERAALVDGVTFPESRKQIENRLSYLKRMLQTNPEKFRRKCTEYGINKKAYQKPDDQEAPQEEASRLRDYNEEEQQAQQLLFHRIAFLRSASLALQQQVFSAPSPVAIDPAISNSLSQLSAAPAPSSQGLLQEILRPPVPSSSSSLLNTAPSLLLSALQRREVLARELEEEEEHQQQALVLLQLLQQQQQQQQEQEHQASFLSSSHLAASIGSSTNAGTALLAPDLDALLLARLRERERLLSLLSPQLPLSSTANRTNPPASAMALLLRQQLHQQQHLQHLHHNQEQQQQKQQQQQEEEMQTLSYYNNVPSTSSTSAPFPFVLPRPSVAATAAATGTIVSLESNRTRSTSRRSSGSKKEEQD